MGKKKPKSDNRVIYDYKKFLSDEEHIMSTPTLSAAEAWAREVLKTEGLDDGAFSRHRTRVSRIQAPLRYALDVMHYAMLCRRRIRNRDARGARDYGMMVQKLVMLGRFLQFVEKDAVAGARDLSNKAKGRAKSKKTTARKVARWHREATRLNEALLTTNPKMSLRSRARLIYPEVDRAFDTVKGFLVGR